MLSIVTAEVTPFLQNCRVLFDADSAKAAVIDPGGEAELLLWLLEQLEVGELQVILTHAHIDHAGGVAALRELWQEKHDVLPPMFAHKAEEEMRASIRQQAMLFGLSPDEYRDAPEPEQYVEHGDEVSIAGHRAKVLFTPGHSPGHVAFYFEKAPVRRSSFERRSGQLQEWREDAAPVLLAGDTLFAGSIGRTDLPGGDHATLLRSIAEQLLTLPDEVIVLSGHGPDTTIGRERQSNPFLR